MVCFDIFEVCYFLRRNRKGKDLDGTGSEEELGEVERGETVIKICGMKKESV